MLLAYSLACGYLPPQVTGSRVTSWQLLTHLVFLQDILGQEQLSAGLWFICINFQLCLMYALILGVRDSTGSSRFDAGMLLGWLLAAVSLFHVNLDPSRDAWALYFFPYFFMGVVVHRALRPGGRHAGFWLYQLLFVAALCVAWRWRLVAAMAVGAALFFAGATGWGSRWPRSRVVAWFGKISYSLFLVHFPVLVLVSTACIRLDWTSPEGRRRRPGRGGRAQRRSGGGVPPLGGNPRRPSGPYAGDAAGIAGNPDGRTGRPRPGRITQAIDGTRRRQRPPRFSYKTARITGRFQPAFPRPSTPHRGVWRSPPGWSGTGPFFFAGPRKYRACDSLRFNCSSYACISELDWVF